MTEADDFKLMLQAIEGSQTLLRAQLELPSVDAAETVSRVSAILSSPPLMQTIERARLRELSRTLSIS